MTFDTELDSAAEWGQRAADAEEARQSMTAKLREARDQQKHAEADLTEAIAESRGHQYALLDPSQLQPRDVTFAVAEDVFARIDDPVVVADAIASAERAGEMQWAIRWKRHLSELNTRTAHRTDPAYQARVAELDQVAQRMRHRLDQPSERLQGIVGSQVLAEAEAARRQGGDWAKTHFRVNSRQELEARLTTLEDQAALNPYRDRDHSDLVGKTDRAALEMVNLNHKIAQARSDIDTWDQMTDGAFDKIAAATPHQDLTRAKSRTQAQASMKAKVATYRQRRTELAG